jgi:hypothetical protein
MATELGIFNNALVALGQRELVSLDDPVETRRVLRRIWENSFVNGCLEAGAWNFALRSVAITDDPPEPSFGFQYRFEKPSDWVRTLKFSAEDTFQTPLNDYTDEGGYWYANFPTVYVQYISSHPTFGGNMAIWPESFTKYVSLALAVEAAPRILGTQAPGINKLEVKTAMALKNAKAKDAQNQPVEFPPLGSWARSRAGFTVTRPGDKN